ncbi:response regulator transcription factor [Novosphingobium flavum]|uniref:Response regulator transcription factor n=1 Tax=Novosphingobium flavum TaxID=1778672 RepID=A0A7X1FR95_9SPHN|nr:response regulator transcription factor [Novosphingobium flavum]MBC2665509.1 response regulator transcription factor [Novosphingobium flavum]
MLVDDHPLVRQALALTVAAIDPAVTVEQLEAVKEAEASLERDPGEALVLLDLHLPGQSGMEGLMRIKGRFPQVPVAIVSGDDDSATVLSAQACGAAGFISKTASRSSLITALGALMAGQDWFPDQEEVQPQEQLTAAQTRVLDCIRRGLMNKQIAHELGMSEHTVKYHLGGIFRKLGCYSRAQLVSTLIDSSARN